MHTDYLFEAIPDSAVLLDKMGRILDWNQGAAVLFGYQKKEMLGKSLNIIYQEHYPFPKLIQETLPHQKKWSTETRYVRKNGIKGCCKTNINLVQHTTQLKSAALVIHQIITPYKDSETKLKHSIDQLTHYLEEQIHYNYCTTTFLLNTLSSHEQIELKLHDSELRFHLLAENATDIISRHTSEGIYHYVSPSCKTLLGYSHEELLQSSVYQLIHYDDVSKLKKAFHRRTDKKLSHVLTYRIRRKDGDYRWYESNI